MNREELNNSRYDELSFKEYKITKQIINSKDNIDLGETDLMKRCKMINIDDTPTNQEENYNEQEIMICNQREDEINTDTIFPEVFSFKEMAEFTQTDDIENKSIEDYQYVQPKSKSNL